MSENRFRLLFGLLWLLFFGVRLAYALVNERQERWLFRAFAIGYLVLPVYALTSWADVAHVPMPDWSRWLGVAVLCAGIGLFGWAHRALGRNWTAVLALSTDHEMVTDGPFRFVRHPMYAAFFMIGVGFCLVSANWLVAAAYLGTLTPMYVMRVPAEEQMMASRFGDRYRRYMEATGRLWPRVGRRLRPEVRRVP
jgi:protein-S-isoprenylcysteine O-methyltransferase Ste14